MSTTVTVDDEYRIVIPEDVRREMNLYPGQKIAVMRIGGSIHFVPVRPLEELRGSLRGAPEFVREKKDREL
jgi:AbrB family looped-hinge helix DNA binding protein